jgi:arylsulfatase A-like enzyme
VPLLPALLRDRGFFTAAVDNIGLWIQRAFERYEKTSRWDHNGTRPWRNGEEVTGKAVKLLREAAGRKQSFFIFLHYWDPHSPYLPPPPFDRMFYPGTEKDPSHTSMDPVWSSSWFAPYFSEWLDGVRDIEFVKAQYDASVAYGDACLGEVFDLLGELGLWEETLVLVQSDHGEELDDHGCWFDHHGLYETNVRVPLLLRFPDRRHAGETFPDLVTFPELAPTIAELVGLPDLMGEGAGPSLVPRFEEAPGTLPTGGVYLTECTWMRKRGWRTPEWKLIEALEPDIYGGPVLELYHLPTDPSERSNAAPDRPEVVARLREERDAHIRRRLAESGLPDPLVEQADALRIRHPGFLTGRKEHRWLRQRLRSTARQLWRR